MTPEEKMQALMQDLANTLAAIDREEFEVATTDGETEISATSE